MATNRSTTAGNENHVSSDNVAITNDSDHHHGKFQDLFPKKFKVQGAISTNVDEKSENSNVPPIYDGEEFLQDHLGVTTIEDLTTRVISLEDDPTLNPWTFRAMFLGMSQ